LVDGLLQRNIVPFLTLYHWDHPWILEEKGGWRKKDMAKAFSEYTAEVVQALSDRVTRWITINEPPCIAHLGYEKGVHAPGVHESRAVVNQIKHHILLAHGMGVQTIRELSSQPCEIGLAHNPVIKIPRPQNSTNEEAARQAFIDSNSEWFDPLFKGSYPDFYLRREGKNAPILQDGELEIISSPTDFLGVNVYTGEWIQQQPNGEPGAYQSVPFPDGFRRTTMNWPVVPESGYFCL